MPQSVKGSRRERELLRILQERGFVVHRVAGSGVGEKAICDLVAVKDGKAFFYECKSRKKYYYPREDSKQLQILMTAANKCGARAMLAVKINHKDWKFVNISDHLSAPDEINFKSLSEFLLNPTKVPEDSKI